MPVPVIDTTTSIWGFPQYQPFEIQPLATQSPTSWTCSALPTGVAINGSTGKITGAGTVAGVTTANLVAINGSGPSTALVVTFGIQANAQSPVEGPTFAWDLDTGAIVLANGATLAAGAPLLWLKQSDKQPLQMKFYKDGAYVDFAISSFKCLFKEFEPAPGVLVGGGATLNTDFEKAGTLDDATWRIVLDLTSAGADSPLLTAALSNYEADTGTFFYALTEFQIEYPTPFSIAPSTLRRTSRTVIFGIERDMIP